MKKSNPNSKWDDRYYVLAYKLAREGHDDKTMAGLMDVASTSFMNWKRKNKDFLAAIEDGRRDRQGNGKGVKEFLVFVKQKMPATLQPLWDELISGDEVLEADARRKVQLSGKRTRQHMFMHAFIACNFNSGVAARTIGISPVTPSVWRKKDRDFNRLMEVVQEAKKDFFEDALMDLVAARDTSAVLFVNKTVNKDRGYDQKVTLKIEGGIQHEHKISVGELSIEVKRMLLDEARKKKQMQLENRSNPTGTVQDAQFEVRKSG